jgi:hypothetical protein
MTLGAYVLRAIKRQLERDGVDVSDIDLGVPEGDEDE